MQLREVTHIHVEKVLFDLLLFVAHALHNTNTLQRHNIVRHILLEHTNAPKPRLQ